PAMLGGQVAFDAAARRRIKERRIDEVQAIIHDKELPQQSACPALHLPGAGVVKARCAPATRRFSGRLASRRETIGAWRESDSGRRGGGAFTCCCNTSIAEPPVNGFLPVNISW